MIKLYIKQAFYQLRENRLISLVSIIGTALAICMIMVIVLVLEVRITDCVPEGRRSIVCRKGIRAGSCRLSSKDQL